jgi:hypothetical protein
MRKCLNFVKVIVDVDVRNSFCLKLTYKKSVLTKSAELK